MATVRFCLIGVGRAGLVHATNVNKRIKNAELSTLCDMNEELLQKAGREFNVNTLYTDYREALSKSDIDAVIIVTPTFTHCEIACEAAKNGKHIFLEKPMALSVDECKTINEAVKKSGTKLQLGFMRRFDPGFMRAKSILDSGEMGRVIIIKSTGRGPGLPPPWTYDISKSNGMLAEVNSHDFDSISWLAGSELTRVYSEAGNFKCLDIKKNYPDFYDNAVVNLRFANGTIGVIDGACPCHYGYDVRVELLCENGVLQIGSIEENEISVIKRAGEKVSGVFKSWRSRFKDAYLAEMEHFVECVIEDKEPSVTGEDGLRAVKAVVAANQSIITGKPIKIC